MPEPQPSAIYLAGPTASGKSAAALELARRLGGEIISVDSMQVYRGLDIGTAKPTAAERAAVPHHLIDVCTLDQAFDAAQFVRLARQAEAEIRGRGHLPIYCGGTGFYFKGLLHGVSEAPPADVTIREQLAREPMEDLLRELQTRDPVASERMDRNNPRRVLRALEVIRLTGRPYSSFAVDAANLSGPPVYVLQRDPADLKARIAARVRAMFAQGLVEETRGLLPLGLRENITAMQAIGYRQVVEYLDGKRPLDETVALVITRTQQFARRQLTWFRHQLPVILVNVPHDGQPGELIWQKLAGQSG